MRIHEIPAIRLLLQALPRVDAKLASMAVAFTVLILFSDSLLPLLGHGLYLLLEVLEQGAEDLLEFVFGLSTRQAQVTLVWVGLPILGFFLWQRLRKPFAAAKARWQAFSDWLHGDWSQQDWLRIWLVLGLLFAALYLFS